MKKTIACLIMGIIFPLVAAGQAAHGEEDLISVAFEVDGQQIACPNLTIDLELGNQHIQPVQTATGFRVPALFLNGNKSKDFRHTHKVSVTTRCGPYDLQFRDMYPISMSPGSWHIGITHPPFWFELFRYSPIIESGAWVSYLTYECTGCDPGMIVSQPHFDSPQTEIDRLRNDQPHASGMGARDDAYALAAYGVNHVGNRNYLTRLFDQCLHSSNATTQDDDICDSRLLDYLTNLYWRGDQELLQPLLLATDSKAEVVEEIGTFNADLLDRQPKIAIEALRKLPSKMQQAFCEIVASDDLSINGPKLGRIADSLHSIGNETAQNCLTAINVGLKQPFGVQGNK